MQIVTGKGFIEDVRMSNIRLLMGSVIIIIALFAQFYNKKFPENRNFLIGCIVLYPFRVFNVVVIDRNFILVIVLHFLCHLNLSFYDRDRKLVEKK